MNIFLPVQVPPLWTHGCRKVHVSSPTNKHGGGEYRTTNMSDRKDASLYWRLKELQNKLKIVNSMEREREIVKNMSKKDIESMHSDYLIMIAKEALEKQNEQT